MQPLTIITACFERPTKVRRLWESIRRHHPQHYFVIADNSRQPLDLSFCADDPKTRVVRCEDAANLSAARMLALREVRTPLFCLVDDDEWFTDQSLQRLQAMIGKNGCDIAGGMILKEGKPAPFSGRFHWENSGLRISFCAGPEVDIVPNFYVARTADFLRAKVWDASLPIAGEHVDSFLTMKLAGFRIWSSDRATIAHEPGGENRSYGTFRRRTQYTADMLNKWRLDWIQYPNGRIAPRERFPRKTKTTAFLILTTGRTGSSALAQCLHTMGVCMGDQLARPPWDQQHLNPDGYFEDWSMVALNGRLTHGRDDFHCREEIWNHAHRLAVHHERIGFKFPGSAHHPQLVTEAIQAAGINEVKYLWSHRNFDDAVASLLRTGWQTDEAEARAHFRRRHNSIHRFLQGQAEHRVHIVHYENLQQDPRKECLALARFCGIEDDAAVARAADTVRLKP